MKIEIIVATTLNGVDVQAGSIHEATREIFLLLKSQNQARAYVEPKKELTAPEQKTDLSTQSAPELVETKTAKTRTRKNAHK